MLFYGTLVLAYITYPMQCYDALSINGPYTQNRTKGHDCSACGIISRILLHYAFIKGYKR